MPVRSLEHRNCLITGAASGIGRATAHAAAVRGAALYLTDINAELLQETVTEIATRGGRVRSARALDISSYEQVKEYAEEIHATADAMDVVMNIAGISTWGAVERLEHQHWKNLVDVNLMGPIHVIENFVPTMIRAGRGGHLVNVSSAAGLFGLPWHAAYSATKFGLRGISEVLRYDLMRHGIGVSLVCPGAVSTPLTGTVTIVGVDEGNEDLRKLKADFHRRAVTPERAAEAIIKGILKNRYMVFTSRDIRVGYWLQRVFHLPYHLAMKRLNDRLHALLSAEASPGTARLPRTGENQERAWRR